MSEWAQRKRQRGTWLNKHSRTGACVGQRCKHSEKCTNGGDTWQQALQLPVVAGVPKPQLPHIIGELRVCHLQAIALDQQDAFIERCLSVTLLGPRDMCTWLNSVGLWLLEGRGATGTLGVWRPVLTMAGGSVTARTHHQARGLLRCVMRSMRCGEAERACLERAPTHEGQPSGLLQAGSCVTDRATHPCARSHMYEVPAGTSRLSSGSRLTHCPPIVTLEEPSSCHSHTSTSCFGPLLLPCPWAMTCVS